MPEARFSFTHDAVAPQVETPGNLAMVCVPALSSWQESLYRWAYEAAVAATAPRPMAARNLFAIMN